jgi:putative restriction endonuclease
MSEFRDWLRRFTALRVDPDKGKGRAPHKPLLLLAVLDVLEAGQLIDGWVTRSPDLVVRFQNFWPIVEPRRQNRGDIRMPFHALSNDGVWKVFDAEGRPSSTKETSVRARLDDGLLSALGDAVFRANLRRLLVATYFPPAEQVALFSALGFEGAADSPEIAAVAEDQAVYKLARETGRSARFKTQVVTGYKFTCALTGYRLTTTEQAGIVEAAHIHQHAKSQNNDPDNGLALSPTAHALFDLGLWSATDDLRVIVKPEAVFKEEYPTGGFSLRAMYGRPLFLSSTTNLRPNQAHLAWHRKEHGFAV